MIDEYKNWLQNALGDEYLVEEEEKIDWNTKKHIALLSLFSGVNYSKSIVFTYNLTVYTNDVKKVMDDLQEKTWMLNDVKLSTNTFPYIRHLISQPSNISNFVQERTEYIGTINMTITLIASLSVSDIKEIKIDNELIDPTQFRVIYSTVTNTQRKNNEEHNNTNITESNLQFELTSPNDYSNLFNKVLNVVYGVISKNVDFDIEIKYTTDFVYTGKVKLFSSATTFDRATLIITSVTFMK